MPATAEVATVVRGGDPSAEELAAIVAAVEMSWPQGGAAGDGSIPVAPSRWRFSGRWWTKPVPSRRVRPS